MGRAVKRDMDMDSERRIEARREEAREARRKNACPRCGRGIRRNLALAGWVQCSQFGSPRFRAVPEEPPCDWQGFTE